MTSLTLPLVLTVLTSFAAMAAGKGEPIYGAAGGDVVLTPDSVDSPVTSITWKHDGDIAMEMYGDEIVSYRQFKGRSMLNTSTGALVIEGLTRDDSGSYTAEINNKVKGTKELRVISRVSKPSLSRQCDADNKYCVFTCEGNTTDAEPITFSWHATDYGFETSTNVLHIWKESNRSTASGQPASSGTADIPDIQRRSSNYMLLIVIILSAVVVVVLTCVIICIVCKCRKGKDSKRTAQETSVMLENVREITDEDPTPAASGDTNGVTVFAEVQETSTQGSTPPVAPDTSDAAERTVLLQNGLGTPHQPTVVSEHTNHVTEIPLMTELEETSTRERTEMLSVISETSEYDSIAAASEETENSAVKSNGPEALGLEEPPEDEQPADDQRDKVRADVPLAPIRKNCSYYQLTDCV